MPSKIQVAYTTSSRDPPLLLQTLLPTPSPPLRSMASHDKSSRVVFIGNIPYGRLPSAEA